MNAFDILVVVLLGAAAIRGYFKGIIAMAAQVAGIIAGVVLCRLFAGDLAGIIGSDDSHATDVVVANVILFIVAWLGCLFLGRMVHTLFKALHLNMINRLCGALFCVLEVALIFSLFMNLWHMVLPASAPADATTGGLRGLLYNVAPTLLGYLN